jgi:endonuclease YncB( thermonuclease family)
MLLRALILSVTLLTQAQAAEIPVRVIQITDGDTVGVIDSENRSFKVRLSGIDAPEKKQAFSDKSKQALSAKVFEKDIVLETTSKDRYGRTLAVLKLDGRNINRELVAEGWAWQYLKYDQSKELREAEASARQKRLGLWADPMPVAPWEFRASVRAK